MPVNDNFANAIVLSSAVNPNTGTYDNRFLWAGGDNIGATQEAGEQPSYTKTVWYKFIAPDPAKSAASQWLVMTSYNREIFNPNGTQPDPTDFDTVLVIYSKINIGLPWALNNIREVLRSDAAAGWEKGSSVIMPAFAAGDEFYIRIDGKKFDKQTQTFIGDEGHFVLSWKPLLDIRLKSCPECPPEYGVGWKCIGTITPGIFAESFPSFGVQPKGSYLLKYCGGAWNYRDGFVVARVPAAADQSWPGNNPGWFLTAFAGANQMTFPEPGNPGRGWPNPGAAEASARCMRLSFELTAAAEVKLHFTDEAYADNSATPTLPHYGLYQLTPSFAVTASSILRNAGIGTTRYHAQIQITNLTQGFFSNMVFTLQASGGVSAPTGPVTLAFTPSGTPGANQTAIFDYDMLPMGKTDGAMTLKVSNPVYDPIPDLSFSLLPILTTQLLVAQRAFRGGPVTLVYLNLGNKGLGPSYDLNAVIIAKDGAGNPITVLNDITGAPASTFNMGQVVGGTTGNGNLFFDLVTVSGAQLTIAYHDTLMDYPPASVSVPGV